MIVDLKSDTQEERTLMNRTSLSSPTQPACLFFNCVTTGETELSIIQPNV